MSEKKRKSKRPKAMRVTTEASKSKLPAPTRKRKATPRETWAEGYAKWEAKRQRVQCPRCEKWVPDHPHDIHTCYDAKALRELPASPIAGQPLDGIGSAPLDVPRAIPCGEDRFPMGELDPRLTAMNIAARKRLERHQRIRLALAAHLPPDTSAYPWGLKFAWWLDGVPTRVRRWLAVRLRWLAGKVEP